MRAFLEMVRSNIVAQAVLSVVMGLFLAVWPETTTITVVYLLALYLAVMGAASLVSYFIHRKKKGNQTGVLASGVFFLVVALAVFLFPETVAGMFSLILGVLLVVGGLVNVARAVELRSYQGATWLPALIVSVLVAVGGIVIVINPFDTTVTFVLVLGVLLIVKGVVDLVIEISLSRSMKK